MSVLMAAASWKALSSSGCFAPTPNPGGTTSGSYTRPISEALQLLDHAELVYHCHYLHPDDHGWSPTRLGLATLANGKAAVRQRIADRTGL